MISPEVEKVELGVPEVFGPRSVCLVVSSLFFFILTMENQEEPSRGVRQKRCVRIDIFT